MRTTPTAIALGAGAALLLTGCSTTPPPEPGPTPSTTVAATSATPEAGPTTGPTVAATSATARPITPLPTGSQPVELDPAQFTTEIDHPYWPMKPGTRWTYREIEDGEVKEVVVVATTQTKKIANGITARVVRDTVRVEGSIIEDTFDWYAQDATGNIW